MSIAPVVFTPGTTPRMYVQNLLTGAWVHRDLSAIVQPVITWNLNGADTFTCSMSPPKPDILDSTGNPLFNEWQHACYLEQGNAVLFGGILLSSQFNGAQWQMNWQGFAGYPSGMPYEGPNINRNNYEALDAVRYLWSWLQSQPDGDLHLDIDAHTSSGVKLGAQPSAVAAQSVLLRAVDKGSETLILQSVVAHDGFPAFASGMQILLGGSASNQQQYTIKSVATDGRILHLTSKVTVHHDAGAQVTQVVPNTPYTLRWWNSTDCGQEIQSIQQEAVFDWTETHSWQDSSKQVMRHHISFNVPRRGARRTSIRFAEGENLFPSSQVTRDGTTFANNVIGLGAGQGQYQIRSSVARRNGRLRRTQIYQDQTVATTARMSSKAQRVLASLININTPTSVVVRDHPNAPFGSFTIGDDILVILNSGWQNQSVWCRITSMAQDPTTNLITLTMLRSDSYSYLAQSGQAGTI